MNWKTWSLLVVALVAGFAAAYGIKSIFFVENPSQPTDVADVSGMTEQLLVANGDLASGSELSALNVRLTLTPEEKAPRDGIFSFNGVAGRKVSRDLKDGEPITLYDLEESEQAVDEPEGFVPPGCTVVPIQISSATKENGNRNYLQTTKLNKMIKSDDVVDVIVVKEAPSKSGPVALPRLVTETVAQNVHVFDVTDENRFSAEGAYRVSTISALLTAEQLENVRKAYEEGKIRIVLHNSETPETPAEGTINIFDTQSSNAVPSGTRYPSYPQAARQIATGSFVPNDPAPVSDGFEIKLSSADSEMTTSGVGSEVGESDVAGETAVSGSEDGLDSDFSGNLINGGFEIALESDADESDSLTAENSVVDSSASKDDSARWNSVDFNKSEEVVSDDDLTSPDVWWLGKDAFRARGSEELLSEETLETTQYERAASEDLTADATVEEADDELVTELTLEPETETISDDVAEIAEVKTDSTTTTNVKKISPFRTVSSKRTNK